MLVAGAGLVAATLAAVGGNQAWVVADAGAGTEGSQVAAVALAARDASSPPTTALALVVLAAWGVVLVTRGRFRRVVAWVGALAAVGLLAMAATAWSQAPAQLLEAFATYGVTDVEVGRTVWCWVSLAAAVVAAAAGVLGALRAGSWPEMGRRYDAPAGAGEAGAAADDGTAAEDREPIDLWQDLDDGRDPTA